MPDAAVSTNGGFVVWQDNITDGSGWGVSASRLDSTLVRVLEQSFRVNVQGHERPGKPARGPVEKRRRGLCLAGRPGGLTSTFTRGFLPPTNTFLTTTDVVVSTLHQ